MKTDRGSARNEAVKKYRRLEMNSEQYEQMRIGHGFIAALDQSGGSTPKALRLYGISETSYSNEEEMFNLIHSMRQRIIQSPVFTKQRILGVILFEKTMNDNIENLPTVDYLWKNKGILSFIKVDNGLSSEVDGVQLMKPIPELATKLASAKKHHVFGTKMRSVIKLANLQGIESILSQQFDYSSVILNADLMPILEPEIDINSPEKFEAEQLLKQGLLNYLDKLDTHKVILKLTLPDEPGFYSALARHPNVLRVVALSGGYTRERANALLNKNQFLIASFSRALTEGLNVNQSEEEFNSYLDKSIESIYKASMKQSE
jgi:fructose-bisphosphate aldolase class I